MRLRQRYEQSHRHPLEARASKSALDAVFRPLEACGKYQTCCHLAHRPRSDLVAIPARSNEHPFGQLGPWLPEPKPGRRTSRPTRYVEAGCQSRLLPSRLHRSKAQHFDRGRCLRTPPPWTEAHSGPYLGRRCRSVNRLGSPQRSARPACRPQEHRFGFGHPFRAPPWCAQQIRDELRTPTRLLMNAFCRHRGNRDDADA